MRACLKFLKHYKPTNFVQIGDFCDWDSISTHPVRSEADLTSINWEIEQSNHLLDEIEKALPKGCKKYMVGGNHEARYPRFKVNESETKTRQLHKFTTWQEEYDLSSRGWQSCEYGEHIEIGKILFTHGWYSSGNHAKKHLELFHKNMLYGHTHQFQVALASGLDGAPVMAASIGTLSRFDLSYLVGKPPVHWTHMFCYVDMFEDGTFSPHFVPIVNGTFYELGKRFDPTPRIF